uniref:Serine/threonine-protein kinase 10-A-like n=1 Tax=Phallusia mammillata TaxID=59560 RepID=A0A6F9DS80_9ASCI|nr:serine/threonine-protein kinase 10-A-like [Phallusia mammillata]
MANLEVVPVGAPSDNFEHDGKWKFQQLVFYPSPKQHRFCPEKLVISIRNTGDLFSIVSFCGTNAMFKCIMWRLCFKYMNEVQKIQSHPDVYFFRNCLIEHSFELSDYDSRQGILIQESPFLQAVGSNEMLTTFFCDVQLFTLQNAKLSEDTLYLLGPLSATILINVKGAIKKSDLKYLEPFVLYARHLKRFEFKTNLKNLIFVVHEFDGKQYGYNPKYLKTILKKYSSPDGSFELLYSAFEKCACYCLPSIGKARSSEELSKEYLESFCEFASDLFTKENQNRNLSHTLLFETSASLTLDTAVSNMKAVNDGSKIIWTILVQHTARHAYFTCIEEWINNYATYITEGIKKMTLDTKYEDIIERANKQVTKPSDSFHKDFCTLYWFQKGSTLMLKGLSMYGLMFEEDFKAQRKKLEMRAKVVKVLSSNNDEKKVPIKWEIVTPKTKGKKSEAEKEKQSLTVEKVGTSTPRRKTDAEKEKDMDGVFQSAFSTFQRTMTEYTGVRKSVDDVAKQYQSASDAAKKFLDENKFEEYSTESWELRMGRFASYMDNMKDAMLKEVEAQEKKLNELKEIHDKAILCYRDTIKEAIKSIEQPFDECHKRSVKAGRKILTASKLWEEQATRKTMETKFTDEVEGEKLFYQMVFKLKLDTAYADNMKQMATYYQQLMNKGIDNAKSVQEFKSLHGQSCSNALGMLKLSKKAIKENGDRLKKEMNKYKEKYKEIFDLKQEVRSAEAKLNVFEKEKLAIDKVETMMSFMAASKLFSSKENLVPGRFPCIRKAWNDIHGNVAVKCKALVGTQNEIMEELKILTNGVEQFQLSAHENIIHVIGYSCWVGAFGAVLEHVDGMELLPFLQHLRKQRFHPPPIINVQFCVDIASALVFLSSRTLLPISGVTIHDVMVTRNFRCKVAGFKYENLFKDHARQGTLYNCEMLFELLSAVVCARVGEDNLEKIKEENYSCLDFCLDPDCPPKVDKKEERTLCDSLQSEIQDFIEDNTTLLDVRNNLARCLLAPNEVRTVDQRWYKMSEYLLEAMKEHNLIGSAIRREDLVPISELWPEKVTDNEEVILD